MGREPIMYTEGEFVYVEYINGERQRFKPTPNNSTHKLEDANSAYILTEDELKWIRQVLSDGDYDSFEISPSYFYKKKTEIERNANKGNVRKELDALRKKMRKFTPQELLELKNEKERKNQGIENFDGIYIIHNCVKDIYYVGQAKGVFNRAYKHFAKDLANPEVYKDYCRGNEFNISLIPLEKTSFSLLDDLEDNAIRAYESYPLGYNRMPGNILNKPTFKNDDYQKVAELILNKIKGTEWFLRLSNGRKRWEYTYRLLLEYKLPLDIHFICTFSEVIKEYKKDNKKSTYKK
ncbi:excinuclease ABC subunit C [Peribacillus asahii]|uniref:excinuclease ABC subunit C n=1 Tax=Peribacillus asahii TaxID=228899 RepID=UPI00207A1DF0|nr:excinuclease ABC subunit C [Peribacillus asahii]USK62463.1 excinuclease ABC subunit C [Peribacillus asahii]